MNETKQKRHRETDAAWRKECKKAIGGLLHGLHAAEDLFQHFQALLAVLLGDPVGDGEHLAVTRFGEEETHGGRAPFFLVGGPGDYFPLAFTRLEIFFLW